MNRVKTRKEIETLKKEPESILEIPEEKPAPIILEKIEYIMYSAELGDFEDDICINDKIYRRKCKNGTLKTFSKLLAEYLEYHGWIKIKEEVKDE
jgi:hypothetical protein